MKNVIIGVCIAFFVGLILQAIQFINMPEVEEGFVSSAITRASDCNCLPGYIPSNQSDSVDGNLIVDTRDSLMYNPNNTRDIYTIDTNNMCNLLPGVNDFDMRTSTDTNNYNKYVSFKNKVNILDASSYNVKGTLSCDIVKQKANTNYFCQSLTDSTKIRKCY